jgi:hypothetical protein
MLNSVRKIILVVYAAAFVFLSVFFVPWHYDASRPVLYSPIWSPPGFVAQPDDIDRTRSRLYPRYAERVNVMALASELVALTVVAAVCYRVCEGKPRDYEHAGVKK